MHLLKNDPLGIFRGIRKRAVAEGFLAPAGGVAHHGRHLPVAAFPYQSFSDRQDDVASIKFAGGLDGSHEHNAGDSRALIPATAFVTVPPIQTPYRGRKAG
jgi:hypothetical protein